MIKNLKEPIDTLELSNGITIWIIKWEISDYDVITDATSNYNK